MSSAKSLQRLLDKSVNGKRRPKMSGRAPAQAIAFTRPEAARALDALMIIDAMVAHGDIVCAEDGSERFSFPLSALIGDILGAWGSEGENDEDEGLAEDCSRTLPSEVAPEWGADGKGGQAVDAPAHVGAPPRLPRPLPGFVRLGDPNRPALVA